jgi:hypothetical protein
VIDCNTQDGQYRYDPKTREEMRTMVAEMSNVPVESVLAYVVIAVVPCDNNCEPPHLTLTTSDMSVEPRAELLLNQYRGLITRLIDAENVEYFHE